MNSQGQLVTARDLVEEAKKRIVILSICVVGLSYLMSCKFTIHWYFQNGRIYLYYYLLLIFICLNSFELLSLWIQAQSTTENHPYKLCKTWNWRTFSASYNKVTDRIFINAAYTLEHYINKIHVWEEKICECYSEKISIPSNEFIEMILVDAAFIIYLFMLSSSQFLLIFVRRWSYRKQGSRTVVLFRKSLVITREPTPFLFSANSIQRSIWYILPQYHIHWGR